MLILSYYYLVFKNGAGVVPRAISLKLVFCVITPPAGVITGGGNLVPPSFTGLFLSISIAIRFSSRFFRSINNLITASSGIGKGNLDVKVPELKADREMELLNKNFNSMIEKLKNQQDKLLSNERHEAWETVARKMAHEIKNPLTPIQLTIDNLNSKYLPELSDEKKQKYQNNLKTILKQIKQ